MNNSSISLLFKFLYQKTWFNATLLFLWFFSIYSEIPLALGTGKYIPSITLILLLPFIWKYIKEQLLLKHVFYIIQENRTYDQVLGDVKEGNGDTSLLLFGERITPNHHKIAKDFVLLDNFYVDGEVSADGHNWTMGAYATDYMEKN